MDAMLCIPDTSRASNHFPSLGAEEVMPDVLSQVDTGYPSLSMPAKPTLSSAPGLSFHTAGPANSVPPHLGSPHSIVQDFCPSPSSSAFGLSVAPFPLIVNDCTKRTCIRSSDQTVTNDHQSTFGLVPSSPSFFETYGGAPFPPLTIDEVNCSELPPHSPNTCSPAPLNLGNITCEAPISEYGARNIVPDNVVSEEQRGESSSVSTQPEGSDFSLLQPSGRGEEFSLSQPEEEQGRALESLQRFRTTFELARAPVPLFNEISAVIAANSTNSADQSTSARPRLHLPRLDFDLMETSSGTGHTGAASANDLGIPPTSGLEAERDNCSGRSSIEMPLCSHDPSLTVNVIEPIDTILDEITPAKEESEQHQSEIHPTGLNVSEVDSLGDSGLHKPATKTGCYSRSPVTPIPIPAAAPVQEMGHEYSPFDRQQWELIALQGLRFLPESKIKNIALEVASHVNPMAFDFLKSSEENEEGHDESESVLTSKAAEDLHPRIGDEERHILTSNTHSETGSQKGTVNGNMEYTTILHSKIPEESQVCPFSRMELPVGMDTSNTSSEMLNGSLHPEHALPETKCSRLFEPGTKTTSKAPKRKSSPPRNTAGTNTCMPKSKAAQFIAHKHQDLVNKRYTQGKTQGRFVRHGDVSPTKGLKPSRFCHICTRNSKQESLLVCANVEKGICRKVTCLKCVAIYSPETKNISEREWTCTHCREICPSKAQCYTYSRVNKRRRLDGKDFKNKA